MPGAFQTALRRGYAIEGSSIVVAEWNYNYLFDTTVTNPPDDIGWILNKEYFTTKSIVSSLRPKSGIFYGMTDDARTNGSNLGLDANRYYSMDEVNHYKYWMCPTPSAGDPPDAGAGDIANWVFAVDRGTLIVDYGQFLNMNKVSVTFNLGPMPIDWSIFVFEETANAWMEIVNPAINDITGVAEIWWDGTNWVEQQKLNELVFRRISKIKIEVRTIDKAKTRFQVVEIAGKREIDITNRVESYNINSSMDNQDFIFPVGKMSANDGAITLNNNDLKMNPEDPTSDFYGLLIGWCQYRTYVKYDLTPWDGASDYTVRTATMWSNDTQQINEYQYSVELFDIFKILQMIDCPAFLVEDQSLARVIATILDMVGCDTYSFEFADWDITHTVKYFWTDGKEKVFDVLAKLVESHQAALFVDEDGLIRLLTRNDITPVAGEEPVWTFRGDNDGLDIPDISKLSKKYSLQINKLNIKYTKRQAKVDDLDITQQPLTSTVWESSDPIVVRAAPLMRNLGPVMTPGAPDPADVWIPSNQAETWPYKGKVNINGELIEYNGKGYAYYNHSTGTPVYAEVPVFTDEDRKAFDQATYNSYTQSGVIGGVSTNPTKQNGYTGRLIISKRDADGTGEAQSHFITQSGGWQTNDFWLQKAGMPWTYPNHWVTPGGNVNIPEHQRDWVNKLDWTETQARTTIANSIATINNTGPSGVADRDSHATIMIKDQPDTEYREIGARLRLRGGTMGRAIIPFYMTNVDGYKNEVAPLAWAFNMTRCYVLNINATEYSDNVNRGRQEISIDYKNRDSIVQVPTAGQGGNGGNIKIDFDKWYDIEIIFRDGSGEILEGGGTFGPRSAIEVFVDGAYMDTWYPEGDANIRPTSLIGFGARDKSIVDFEYMYGTTTTPKGRIRYTDDDEYDAFTLTLPPGTNVTQTIPWPVGHDWMGDGAFGFSTWGTAATIHQLEMQVFTQTRSLNVAGAAGLVVKPDQRLQYMVLDTLPDVGLVKFRYTAVNPLSVIYEYSRSSAFPYGIDNEPTPPPMTYYDILKGGYVSTKVDEVFFTPQKYSGSDYLSSSVTTPVFMGYFFDDFGSIVHEVRDISVDYDAAPAKGVSIYSSNPRVKIIGHKYNPMRGDFTLVNTSHRDEIVSGTEQIDESNSIDQALMLYGYVLEDKGEEIETVTNPLSVLRHGFVAQDLDATWIFTKEEAKSLGEWVTSHWGEAMDTLTMETFCSTFIQIGDKVSIYYPNAHINAEWTFVVTDKQLDMGSQGLSTTITVRRVR
jgi:hypothetical protein